MTGKAVQLPGPILSIGSVAGNYVVLSDPAVSRHHAEIRLVGLDYWVRDLGSTNGVYHNGRRIDEGKLASGDRLRMGNSEIVFEHGLLSESGDEP
jgi:pSer/pThr/pTyr-binding forkhead associated (FHA) protein